MSQETGGFGSLERRTQPGTGLRLVVDGEKPGEVAPQLRGLVGLKGYHAFAVTGLGPVVVTVTMKTRADVLLAPVRQYLERFGVPIEEQECEAVTMAFPTQE